MLEIGSVENTASFIPNDTFIIFRFRVHKLLGLNGYKLILFFWFDIVLTDVVILV